MIKALAPDGPDQSFHERTLPWRPSGDDDLLDAHALYPTGEAVTVDMVAIPKQEAWSLVPRESLDDLLSRPLRRRVGGDVEVQHTAPMVSEDEKDEQDLIPHDRDNEEVDRDDVFDVIPEECAPGGRRGLALADHVLGDGGLGEVDADHGEFADDPGCTPKWVG
jgi:hypothetical protein